MSSFSPIALFVYNRPDVLRKTLVNLSRNPEISSSKLFVFSDGSKNHDDGVKIHEVRKIISEITWCCEVIIVNSEENIGLAKSIVKGINTVLKEHETVIVLEDDLLVGKGFLKYMNDALNAYKDSLDVISISGYMYPVKQKLPETFFMSGADCLGWATWRRGWNLFEPDARKLYKELMTHKLNTKFDYENNYPFTEMLQRQAEGNNYSWAVLWNASAFLRNKLTLYPGLSLVEHIGMNGTNYSSDPFMNKINFTDQVKVVSIPTIESTVGWNAFVDFFRERREYRVKNNQKNKFSFISFIRSLLVLSKHNLIYNYLVSVTKNTSKKELNYFSGNYKSWKDASAHAAGYDVSGILEKVKRATLKVINEEAVYERDTVLFFEPENWIFLNDLLRIAAENNNKLSVLDFGGALGSIYFQSRKSLASIGKLEWSIVEQKHYVDCGNKYIQNQELKFYYNLDEVFKKTTPDVVVLSSVIQYVENPYALLEEILSRDIKYVIIDRTCFFSDDQPEVITIQYVDPRIFKATIPVHILSLKKFLNMITSKYILLSTFECERIKYLDLNCEISHKGFIFSLK